MLIAKVVTHEVGPLKKLRDSAGRVWQHISICALHEFFPSRLLHHRIYSRHTLLQWSLNQDQWLPLNLRRSHSHPPLSSISYMPEYS